MLFIESRLPLRLLKKVTLGGLPALEGSPAHDPQGTVLAPLKLLLKLPISLLLALAARSDSHSFIHLLSKLEKVPSPMGLTL